MFFQIKLKAKEYANENAKKKSIRGLFFRRLKFYDMMFSFLAGLFLIVGFADPAKAGGNDPTIFAKVAYYQDWIGRAELLRSGGGNDPTAQIFAIMNPHQRTSFVGGGNEPVWTKASLQTIATDGDMEVMDGGGGHDPTCEEPTVRGGGGHDPDAGTTSIKCCLFWDGEKVISVYSPRICRAQELLIELEACERNKGDSCNTIEDELIDTLTQPNQPVER